VSDADRTLAMFPLGTALLPGGLLPLHVFEPRYRQMIQDCLAAAGEPEFGQVLITRGRETGGGDVRAAVGTAAQMMQVEALDGGRYALVALGSRRIRIARWLDDDPYPRAVVDDWPDDLTDCPDRTAIDAAARRVGALLAMAAAVERTLGRTTADAFAADAPEHGDLGDVDVAADPVLASYQLATMAPIGAADRYRLLTEAGPASRLVTLDAILDDVQAMLEFRLS